MALRIQLVNDYVGSLVIDKADPIDINSLTQTIKRSDKNDGVVFEIVFDLEFIKEGRRFIKQAFEVGGGIDAQVLVNIYELDPNARRWKLYGAGTVNYNTQDLGEDTVKVTINQTGFQVSTLNQITVDVDLETTVSQNGSALPPNTVITDLEYHSKVIESSYEAGPTDDSTHQDILDTTAGVVLYSAIDNGNATVSDLTTINSYSWQFVQYTKVDSNNFQLPFFEAAFAGPLDVHIRLSLNIAIMPSGFPGIGSGVFKTIAVFEHRDADGNQKSISEFGTWIIDWHGSEQEAESGNIFHEISQSGINVAVGDQFYAYIYGYGDPVNFFVEYIKVTPVLEGTSISLTQATESAASKSKTILLYEAFQRCLQYYTNQIDCFRSTLLGRTDIKDSDSNQLYQSDGKYSLIGVSNGNNIRGKNSTITTNLQDLIDFVNSLTPIGFGFQVINGKTYAVVEELSYFYNKSKTVVSLGKVYDVHKKIVSKRYYNQIEIGYSVTLNLPTTNGVDEFNTIRRFVLPLVNTSNKLTVSTKFLAGGYQIEFQRRLAGTTDNSDMDDSIFVVVVIRDGNTFKTKKAEGYDSITNVTDYASGYNYDISPARNLRNWLPVIASSLIYSFSKVITFSYGEVNYLMTSKKTGEVEIIDEHGNVDVSPVEPIWDNMTYDFENVPLNRDQLSLIKSDPFAVIEFEDQFGEKMEGFLSSNGIQHDSNAGTATVELLKVYRKK
jgi:hypothetical protein